MGDSRWSTLPLKKLKASGDGLCRSCYHKSLTFGHRAFAFGGLILTMCGIFGIANQAEASRLTYLGLYALQHRGQESTGIASSDEEQVYLHKSMGHVADVYGEETLAKLRGVNALCHNGNLINAMALRRDLEEQGALFQSTSDSEVILHLLARSQETDILEAL